MIIFENTEVWGFEHALRGMRNPLNSWDKSDSYYDYPEKKDFQYYERYKNDNYIIGPKDLDLCQKLIAGGPEHRKFLRQIFVSVDITAPLYWWKEASTYKVGTVANSCSTMHTLMKEPITKECFSFDTIPDGIIFPIDNPGAMYDTNAHEAIIDAFIELLECLRVAWNKEEDPTVKYYIWRSLIQLLPESWMQKRTVTLNYENLRSMYFQRKNHKLDEWKRGFCNWVSTLPYARELIMHYKMDDVRIVLDDKVVADAITQSEER